jgi:hypothetical protein
MSRLVPVPTHSENCCLLCPGPVEYVGLWVPAGRLLQLSGPGVIAYGLCTDCTADPTFAPRVEKFLLDEAESGRMTTLDDGTFGLVLCTKIGETGNCPIPANYATADCIECGSALWINPVYAEQFARVGVEAQVVCTHCAQAAYLQRMKGA